MRFAVVSVSVVCCSLSSAVSQRAAHPPRRALKPLNEQVRPRGKRFRPFSLEMYDFRWYSLTFRWKSNGSRRFPFNVHGNSWEFYGSQ